MEHIDIELTPSDGSILILTDDGELIEMHVAPASESVLKAISSRPPASITLSGAAETRDLLDALTTLGHDVSFASEIEQGSVSAPPL